MRQDAVQSTASCHLHVMSSKGFYSCVHIVDILRELVRSKYRPRERIVRPVGIDSRSGVRIQAKRVQIAPLMKYEYMTSTASFML